MTDKPADRRTPSKDSAMRIVAIDGPAGSGKSTVARRVAAVLGLDYLDTGAMYRSATFAVLSQGIHPEDAEAVAQVTRDMDWSIRQDGTVLVDGVDATSQIRGTEVTNAVSIVAANPLVRSELVRRQREWAHDRKGGVLEGRDIGSVVFPDASLKVYLTASPEVRAQRRAAQEQLKLGQRVEPETVRQTASDIQRRDRLDSERAQDPLRQVDDAVEIDTSDLTTDEVVRTIVRYLDHSR